MESAAVEALRAKLSTVPKRPGVYTFQGAQQKILYIGKARNLQARLRQYFHDSAGLDHRKAAMVALARDFTFIATANELEALALEANLIKQHKPRFNILLRDDKSYPYLRLSVQEQWPTLQVVRRMAKDGALYFGPYIPSSSMYEALSFVRKHFTLRPCKYRLDRPMRPCIRHQMGRCPAPCAGLADAEFYKKQVEEVALFLKGRSMELLDELEQHMTALAQQERFEEAASVRDRIFALRRAWQSQKVIDPALGDMDIIGAHLPGGDEGAVVVLFVRAGVMVGAREYNLKDIDGMDERELAGAFVEAFYSRELTPPERVVIWTKPDGGAALRHWLRQRRGDEPVSLYVPVRGSKEDELLQMARTNARIYYESRRGEGAEATLEELRRRLSLGTIPRSIGAFDISNISGSEAVAAYVYWADGEFRKDKYRNLKIATVQGQDDYAMMREAVRRVLADVELPDLVLIDGGLGQLQSAMQAAAGLMGPEGFISIAKRPDRLFKGTGGEPLDLEDKLPSSLLLKRIRDEVHRFAIRYHKKLRSRRALESPLKGIPGIGPRRHVALLKRFGSLEGIENATNEALCEIAGITPELAERIKVALRQEE